MGLPCFLYLTPAMMQHCNHSTKSRMTRVDSDDEGQDVTFTSPINQLPTSGQWELFIFLSNAPCNQPESWATQDYSYFSPKMSYLKILHFFSDHFLLQLDPAYLEQLNNTFVTVKHPRTYVSTINSLSLNGFECTSSRSIPLKMASRMQYISWWDVAMGRSRWLYLIGLLFLWGSPRHKLSLCWLYGCWIICRECVVSLHQCNPLHCIEVCFYSWPLPIGLYLHDANSSGPRIPTSKRSFEGLGLWIQLGHKAGEICWNRGRVAGDDFVVLDINGIHEVRVNFCDCETSKPEFIQLLHFGWFPASVDCPKDCGDFFCPQTLSIA